MTDSGGYLSHHGSLRHSHSTPLTPGGGGSSIGADLSRTPPATPKKGGKILAVRVQMLDDSITMFQVQAKALGRLLFEQVCRQLNLLEADYFGLEYTDPTSGARYWLDLEKPLGRQVGLSLCDALLRFCTKFYTPDPAHLEEEFTRYLLCLQVKRDLAQGYLQCNDNTAALMASYIVQSECGDYVVEDYPDHTYLSSYKFVPHQDAELERRIMENHKKHAGQSPAEADLNLLETARRCEFYGMKMHPSKDDEGVPLNLSVAHMGIVVFQNYTKINTFSWAKIRKLSFKRKRFLVKLHPEGYKTEGYYKDTVEFFFEGRNECKNFWKKCVEHHGFFRCSSVKTFPRHKARVISRGSSFRYSGRTQKQIVEFVRENYVKRQTFQRSQSFRHSRCVHSSVASVGTSISAHPLLPLGDNAVAGTPASLSCGSMTLDDPGSPGGRYPGSAPCTSPAHTMEHHHHHHTHHSHQGLSGIGRPASRQDTLSPATSVASSPSPPPGQDTSIVTTIGISSANITIPTPTVVQSSINSITNNTRHSESCSNIPTELSDSQVNITTHAQYSSSYPEQATSSHDDISHDSYDLLADNSDEEEEEHQVIIRNHRLVGRTRSDPSKHEIGAELKQLRMARSEPSRSMERENDVGMEDDREMTQPLGYGFDDRQENIEPFYENTIIEKRFREANERFCSHCRGTIDHPLASSKFGAVRSEPMLCQGTSRMYSDDDSSDQYVDARVEGIPSDDNIGREEIPSSRSSPEIFPMEEAKSSPRPFGSTTRFPSDRLPSPKDETAFYFPEPGETIKSPLRQEVCFSQEIPPYSPRQPLIPEQPLKSPHEKENKPHESRPLKSPPPPSHPNSPRQILSPRQLLSPRGCEVSPRSPTRRFFPETRSPTSPRQSLLPPQETDPSPVRSPPPVLSPKILKHQASIDLLDEFEVDNFKPAASITESPVHRNELDYVLHKRHTQSDSGSGSESSSDHRSRRAAPRRRALNNQSGQAGNRAPVPLFTRGSLEQRRQQRNRGNIPKPLEVVALHCLPPTTAFSSDDDTVEGMNEHSDKAFDSEQRRAEIHGLKLAFLLSGVAEEEPRAIDSSRVHISDSDSEMLQPILDLTYDRIEESNSPELIIIDTEENDGVVCSPEMAKSPICVIDEEPKYELQLSPQEGNEEMKFKDLPTPEANETESSRRASLSRMKSMSEESDDTETARTVVTPKHTANRKASLNRTASISEDSDACLGSDTGRKNKMASDESDFEGKIPEMKVTSVNDPCSATEDLNRTLEERRRVLMASSEDDSDHVTATSNTAHSSDEGHGPAMAFKPPYLSAETRQESVSELEKALIRALMRSSSTDDEALSRQTSIDRVIKETTDPAELEKILIRAIMRSASTEDNPSRQASIEVAPSPIPEVSDSSELEKALIRALMRNSSTEDDTSLSGSKQSSIDSSRVSTDNQISISTTGITSFSIKDDTISIEDPVELEKALIRALMRNSSTDDEFSRQTSIDSTRVNIETPQQSTVQQALDLEKVLLRTIMKSSSEDEPPKTIAQQNELEMFLLQSLIKTSSEEDLVFVSDKRRASCPMTKVEKDAAEFESQECSKPRRASEGGRNQTVEFHHDEFRPRGIPNESLYHSTHDLTKAAKHSAALELFESRRREMPLRRCSYPPSSSEEDEGYVKPRQTRSSYVPSSSEEEELNQRANANKASLSDHALSRRSHIEGMRRAMLDSSGSSSLEDDNPVFLPSDPPAQGVGTANVLLDYAVSAAFPPARTLSRISERSTTSEQERSSEEESKVSSPSSDSEATISEISSGAGRGENSLSSDPSSSDQRPHGEHGTKKKAHVDKRLVVPKSPTVIAPDEPDLPQTVTASTYIVPSASSTSFLETYYLEVRPELASPVTLPPDSSSTDDNQMTLQDSPSSSSSRYDLADQMSHPDFFTPITCTPPLSPPLTPRKRRSPTTILVLEEAILSPDLPLPPPPPESSRPCSLDDPGWGDDLPPPPPNFTSVSPVFTDDEVIIKPMEERRRPFTDPTYEYEPSSIYSGCYTLPRRHKSHSHGHESSQMHTGSHTLPRRHSKKALPEVTPSFQGQKVVIPVKPVSTGHHTFPRQRKHRSSHIKGEQPSSNTLPRARHRVAVSLEVRRGRMVNAERAYATHQCTEVHVSACQSRHSEV